MMRRDRLPHDDPPGENPPPDPPGVIEVLVWAVAFLTIVLFVGQIVRPLIPH